MSVDLNAVDDYISNQIKDNTIIIFSKSTCIYSLNAKKLLQDLKYTFKAIELDELEENGDVIRDRLIVKTGQVTLPCVFIKEQHIGGFQELELLDSCGILDEIAEGKIAAQEKFDYDVTVIGGGAAGLSVAFGCANQGKNVCLVNYVAPTPLGTEWGIGGTCTNVGCVPKKMLHRASVLGFDLRDASVYGWAQPEEDKTDHDWSKLVNAIQEHIKSLNWKIRKDLMSEGIVYINGYASLQTNHCILVKSEDGKEETISTKNIVIAVGCRPRYLDFPGAKENCISSDDIFSLEEFPDKTLIIGGSYVALELASFLNALKADVTVMVRSEILGSIIFDRDAVNSLESEMTRKGVHFLSKGTAIQVIKVSEKQFNVECMIDETTPYTDRFSTVILAVGRVPSTDGLELQNVGIKLCTNCKIPTNEKDQTVVKNIFAIGDCANGRPELSSSALAAGRLLAKRMYRRSCRCTADYRFAPTALFTSPEYACCGFTEATAIQLYGPDPVRVYKTSFTPMEQVITEPAAKCTAKIITVADHRNVEKLAGIHLVGPNASEIIQGFALALKLGATKKDLDLFVGIHPTCAEKFSNMPAKEDLQTQGC